MEDYSSLFAALGALAIFLVIIIIAWAVFYYVGMWKLYVKAGKPGWAAIVPFYNDWVFITEMAGLKWWWFLIACAGTIASLIQSESVQILSSLFSIASLVASFVAAYNIGAKVGKPNDVGNAILLTLFGGIIYPIMGYSKNTVWNANVPVSENGIFDKDKVVTPANPGQPTDVQPQVIPAEQVQQMPVESPVQSEEPKDGE